MRIIAGFAFLVLGCIGCFSQSTHELRLRVLDYRTGQPEKGWKIAVSIANRWVTKKTADDGATSFRIPDPLAQNLQIDAEAAVRSEWSCAAYPGIFDASVVFEKGVVAPIVIHPLCEDHIYPLAEPHAGEIVIYVRRLSPWLTLRRFGHEAVRG